MCVDIFTSLFLARANRRDVTRNKGFMSPAGAKQKMFSPFMKKKKKLDFEEARQKEHWQFWILVLEKTKIQILGHRLPFGEPLTSNINGEVMGLIHLTTVAQNGAKLTRRPSLAQQWRFWAPFLVVSRGRPVDQVYYSGAYLDSGSPPVFSRQLLQQPGGLGE